MQSIGPGRGDGAVCPKLSVTNLGDNFFLMEINYKSAWISLSENLFKLSKITRREDGATE